ncbi:FecR family protein [Paludibacter sp. 221]|uniref:FecR family protein n=1 Tax=Paludibacter sp. 221 TaxID=2302939 RepID=UPI0013D418D3|nr:FecR family protein [Paludibacter sp. 221]NDV46585.1 FecR family protein [Paludibacter sp. 221]
MMKTSTPTKQELSGYFFNNCDEKTAQKVEHWFYANGKSPEATDLLFTLWEELEISATPKEEIHIAFEEFRNRLVNAGEIPVVNRKQRRETTWINRVQRVAAILLLPVMALSAYLYFSAQTEKSVVWSEKSVAYGDIANVALPDGTVVWLNAGSKIIYPDKFTSKKRQVFFTGEGFFNVAKDTKKPFIVQANESNIEVLGTKFNLKSYAEDKTIKLSLLEGSVAFSSNSKLHEGKKYIMKPGEQVCYNRDKHTIQKSEFSLEQYSSWKDGKYYFKNETLEEITRQLERNFNLKIVIKNDSLKDIRYHMAFVNNESPEEILKAIDSDKRIHVKRQGQLVEIY